MKIAGKMALIITVLCLGGCADLQSNAKYTDLANEHEFSYFFPKPSFVRTFATLDEAYEYIKTAQAKFSDASKKPRAKGVAGKLTGKPPAPASAKQPVTVVCFMEAWTADSKVELPDNVKNLEEIIRSAISALDVFMVFYGDMGAVMPNYHLKSGYSYNSNSLYKQYYHRNVTYDAEYPSFWNTEKAFSYLRKEID